MKTWPLTAKILWGTMVVMNVTVLLLSFTLHMSARVFADVVASMVGLTPVLMAFIFVLRAKHHV